MALPEAAAWAAYAVTKSTGGRCRIANVTSVIAKVVITARTRRWARYESKSSDQCHCERSEAIPIEIAWPGRSWPQLRCSQRQSVHALKYHSSGCELPGVRQCWALQTREAMLPRRF